MFLSSYLAGGSGQSTGYSSRDPAAFMRLAATGKRARQDGASPSFARTPVGVEYSTILVSSCSPACMDVDASQEDSSPDSPSGGKKGKKGKKSKKKQQQQDRLNRSANAGLGPCAGTNVTIRQPAPMADDKSATPSSLPIVAPQGGDADTPGPQSEAALPNGQLTSPAPAPAFKGAPITHAGKKTGPPTSAHPSTSVAAPPRNAVRPPRPAPVVGIVGGGVAGLYAAFLLKFLGIPFEIVEAHPNRLGGRLYTYRFDPAALMAEPGTRAFYDYVDLGAMRYPLLPSMQRLIGCLQEVFDASGELIHPDDPSVLRCPFGLVHMLNSERDKATERPLVFQRYWYHDQRGNDLLNFGGVTRRREQVRASMEQVFPLTTSQGGTVPDEDLLGKTTQALQEEVYAPFTAHLQRDFNGGFRNLLKVDAHTVRTFMQERGYPPSAIALLEKINSADGLYDLALVESVLDEFDLSGTDKWVCIQGGSSRLVEMLAKNLKRHGGEQVIKLGHCVQRIVPRDNGKIAVEMSVDERQESMGTPVMNASRATAAQPAEMDASFAKFPVKLGDGHSPESLLSAGVVEVDSGHSSAEDGSSRSSMGPSDGSPLTAATVTGTETPQGATVSNPPSPTSVVREYEHVILTTTLKAMQKMDLSACGLSPCKSDAIQQLHYDQAVKVAIRFKKRWWQDSAIMNGHPIFGGASATDLQVRTVVYPSYGLECPDAPGWLIASYSWAKDAVRMGALPKEEAVEECLRCLEQLHGPVVREQFEGHYVICDWSADPYAGDAFALFGAREFTTLFDGLIAPELGGRLVVAGEATSVHHAWVVGALNSAYRAVEQILQSNERLRPLLPKLKERFGELEEVEYGGFSEARERQG